jgi:hypothetical protein
MVIAIRGLGPGAVARTGPVGVPQVTVTVPGLAKPLASTSVVVPAGPDVGPLMKAVLADEQAWTAICAPISSPTVVRPVASHRADRP